MQFKRLAYTSLAALDLDEQQLLDLHDEARDLNGIDGISGMLVFNGTHFLQWIEGPPKAIDELVERIRRDSRHSAFEIRDEHLADERLFGDWAMELVQVRGRLFSSRSNLPDMLPPGLPPAIRDRLVAMAEQVAPEVDL